MECCSRVPCQTLHWFLNDLMEQRFQLSSGSNSDPNTLWTLSRFTKSQSRIRKGLESSSPHLSSPTKREIEKTYKMTINVVHNHLFLQPRCAQLEATDRRQTKERVIKHKFTIQKGILEGQEGGGDDVVVEDENRSKDISIPKVPAKLTTEPILPSMPLVRRQVTYSGCGLKGHRYSQCPTRAK